MAVRFARTRLAALLLCAGLTSIGAHADSSISYIYTALGQMASSAVEASTTSYSYNAVGDVRQFSLASGNIID